VLDREIAVIQVKEGSCGVRVPRADVSMAGFVRREALLI